MKTDRVQTNFYPSLRRKVQVISRGNYLERFGTTSALTLFTVIFIQTLPANDHTGSLRKPPELTTNFLYVLAAL